MTCPWLSEPTSRIGQARSTMPAMSNRRENSAITRSNPNCFSNRPTALTCAEAAVAPAAARSVHA
jgi:hypothetical protein